MMKFSLAILSCSCLLIFGLASSQASLVATDYPSIQDALDENPGRIIEVPPGDYTITAPIRLTTDNSGLSGFGRILQDTPDQTIVVIENAKGVIVRDVTLTRTHGREVCTGNGIDAKGCTNLTIDNVRVLYNRTRNPNIAVDTGNNVRISNCLVENYMSIAIDDRTKGETYGFAFKVLDGTGINVRGSTAVILQGNSVIEHEMLPTQEIKEKYGLGKFTKKNPVKGSLTKQSQWDQEYYNAWHQGAAICIPTPETDDYVQLLGNYVENAAQGFDIHADHVIMADNIINNAFIGMKAMHGARNLILAGNQISKSDLWSINLMPGAGSHAAGYAAHKNDDPSKSVANIDGHSIVANNIISDFGYGSAHWMWPGTAGAIQFNRGQLDFNPPLTDVIVEGNVVYDTGKDQVLKDGKPVVAPPNYRYAIFIAPQDGQPGPPPPQGIHLYDNLMDAGTQGTTNPPPAAAPSASPSPKSS